MVLTSGYKIPLLLENDMWYAPTLQQIEQSREANEGRIIMETCLQREGMKNQMGRIYPHKILLREFNSYQPFVDERSAGGELDHPETSVVSLERTCILITKQWWKNNDRLGKQEWWGEFEVLTPEFNDCAKKVHGFVKDKVKFGISSRGVGSVEHNRQQEADVVQDDFVIIAFDIVSHPSTHWAIPHLKIGTPMVNVDSLHESKQQGLYKRYVENKISMLLENKKRGSSTAKILY